MSLSGIAKRAGLASAIIAFHFQASTLFADPPANDTCATAQIVSPGGYFGSTVEAVKDLETNCSAGSLAPDVFYSFTPETSGTVAIRTYSETFDTVLSVFNACNIASEIDCNDDSGGDNTSGTGNSEVKVDVAAGTTYLIRVGGFGSSAGSFALSIGDVNGTPSTLCGNVREFPSISSTIVAGNVPFVDSTDTGAMWSAAHGDGFSQSFVVVDRPVYFEMVLDLYIINGLGLGQVATFDVKVGGSSVGNFNISSTDPSETRRRLFFTFSGQVGLFDVELRMINNVGDGLGSVSFGYAGAKQSYIEFQGAGSTDVEETYDGYYASTGDHFESEQAIFVGYTASVPAVANYNGFVSVPGFNLRGTKGGALRMFVSDYASPDPSETIEVWSYEGTAVDITSNHPPGPEGIAIHDDLQGGTLLGSLAIRPSDVGRVVEIPLNPALSTVFATRPITASFGLHLGSRDHADQPLGNEYIHFGTFANVHSLTAYFCPELESNSMVAIDQQGNFLKFDPVSSRIDYMAPLGDQSTDLEYDAFNDRLLAFEAGFRELRPVNIRTFQQNDSVNAMEPFSTYKFIGPKLYGLTGAPELTSRLLTFDPLTGQITPADTDVPARMGGMALDRLAGRLYAVESALPGRLYRIDPYHHQVTLVGPTGVALSAAEFGPNGILYAAGVGGAFYSIDTNTAAATLVAVFPTANITGLAKVRSPFNRRELGDFDTDFCTGLNDFLILLDNWQFIYNALGAPEINLFDFLSLLDNWQLGPGC